MPTSARAAVTVGQMFDPTGNCGPAGGVTYVQRASPGDAYVVPTAGVITSWSFHAGPVSPTTLKLKVVRPAPGPGLFAYTVVGDTPAQSGLAPGIVNNFPARIPVLAGDRLGAYVLRPSSLGCPVRPDSSYEGVSLVSDPPPGSTDGYSAPAGFQIDIAATLEPDCDNDGFGDETQDEDTTVCPPGPTTSISKQPKDKVKTKKKKVNVTFEFASNEQGSTFSCVLDGQQEFKTCNSPLTVSVKKGEHTFSVTATDVGGNAGPAAIDTFKVKRKRKR